VALGASTARTHHERWDGAGYPQGLAGEQIPLEGRIAALADVYDAMTSHRAYRRAVPADQVVEHIVAQRGKHFDPDLVTLFVDLAEQFRAVRLAHPDPEPLRTTRVLVVDDHRMFAESILRLLSRDLGLDPVGTAGSVAEALAMATTHRPDVVLMDLELPDGDGLEATRRLRAALPATQVLLLSGRVGDVLLPDAMRAGCAGYLLKSEALHQLTRVVRQAADGEPVLPTGAIHQVLGALKSDRIPPTSVLTRSEVDVLSQVARGLGIDSVADRLGLSSLTVRSHLQTAMSKMGVHTRLEAVVTAVRQGLVPVG
jgi:DNA-binding NarL/FixJ family response regulator